MTSVATALADRSWSAPAAQPTTVLLHGFTGDPHVFDHLASRIQGRIVRPLLPGHGPRPASVETWDREVERLGEWLYDEGVRDAHLVGYSLGGRLGWHLAARDDLFARCTLIGAHPGLDTDADRRARRGSDQAWIDRLAHEGVPGFVAAWESLAFWNTQVNLPSAILDAQRSIRHSHTAQGLADALRRLGLAEMPARPAPRIPVHLVVGALDAKHVRLASKLPHPLTRVPAVGHNVVLEAPDALTELLG